ncbi:hypothetical protein NM688_g6538 [Phlebia brevispora]|uniref:Uncharacterized protein n=1 Tax=Phlebia brevispora TaxID=194682 RepID=A0ACC1SEZ3_9APHY|nr:hypothetical protein NM688_g6538 [Phlebia brevispora]
MSSLRVSLQGLYSDLPVCALVDCVCNHTLIMGRTTGFDVVLGADWLALAAPVVARNQLQMPVPGTSQYTWCRTSAEEYNASGTLREYAQYGSSPSLATLHSACEACGAGSSSDASQGSAAALGESLYHVGGDAAPAVASGSCQTLPGVVAGTEEVGDVSLSTAEGPAEKAFYKLSRAQLCCRLAAHGLAQAASDVVDDLRVRLISHLHDGDCTRGGESPACVLIRERYMDDDSEHDAERAREDLRLNYLRSVRKRLADRPLRALLQSLGISFSLDDTLRSLRCKLRSYVTEKAKAKDRQYRQESARQTYWERSRVRESARLAARELVASQWPRRVGDSLKEKLVRLFRAQTSSDALSTFTCACCARASLYREQKRMNLTDMPLDLLRCPEYMRHEGYHLPLPLEGVAGVDPDVLLDPAGLANFNRTALLCRSCYGALNREVLPDLALANGMYIGPSFPEELRLTVVEEAMIALCRAKCCIVRLSESGLPVRGINEHKQQRAMKGNIIVHPQKPGEVASVLPASIEETLDVICVIFVGQRRPTREWLLQHAKPLTVRASRVRRALQWLKAHHPGYRDVEIDEDRLDALPREGLLPYNIEVVPPSAAQQSATSRYDADEQLPSASVSRLEDDGSCIAFQNVVITDVDGKAPMKELTAAAVRHVTEKNGSYIQIPHGPKPVNEFCNPTLLPYIYPTLFPYGVGAPEHPLRARPVSFKRHIRYLFARADRQFQEHYSFLFVVFNILQRREVLLKSKLKVAKRSFHHVAQEFQCISPDAIARVCDRFCEGGDMRAYSEDERRVLKLMREVRLITSNVPGTSASKLHMRNQIRATMNEKGPPSFYITINPADCYNPLVLFLAGKEIDVDQVCARDVCSEFEQTAMIARNPFIGARFFDNYMRAFIDCLLRYDASEIDVEPEGGVLGHVTAYYGCVESQGRGTLHCHMVVWVEGGMNPEQIRDRVMGGDVEFADRLIQYLDDTISTSVPPHPDGEMPVRGSSVHPCTTRGPNGNTADSDYAHAVNADVHWLADYCQRHEHKATCYKYVKPGEKKECRFDLHEDNVIPATTFSESGELSLRCLDGLVNNFNATILRAIRCNMDIKFIASGEAAKAVVYYITDYITKSELKTHVAYAALELAVRKLAAVSADESDEELRAKHLLQKCAFALLHNQEMPAEQVAMFLEGKELCYHSHEYSNLYWPSFETYVDAQQPSPECRRVPTAECARANRGADGLPSADGPSDPDAGNGYPGYGEGELSDDETDNVLDEEAIAAAAEEVTLSTDEEGQVVPLADQIENYVYRGRMLDSINVWDFVRCVEKTKGSVPHMAIEHSCEVEELRRLLADRGRKRPSCELLRPHRDCQKSHLKIRHPRLVKIAVPIGPAIPRADREDVHARYCRLMLILFKPWRSAHDLRRTGQSWQEAFEEFHVQCADDVKRVIYNIQFMYECKDSREDHFRNRAHLRKMRFSRVVEDGDGPENALAEDAEDVDILEHLDDVAETRVHAKARSDANALECLAAADRYGLYCWQQGQHVIDNEADGTEQVAVQSPAHAVPGLEAKWTAHYHSRRSEWKRSAAADSDVPIRNATEDEEAMPHVEVATYTDASVGDDVASESFAASISIAPPVVANEFRSVPAVVDVMRKWTLNKKQSQAFEIIARHADSTESCSRTPLRMFLGGPGGTGKSRVIDALRDYFQLRGEGRRFRLASYTGVAACNINGMTLHSALCITTDGKLPRVGSRAHNDLVRDVSES